MKITDIEILKENKLPKLLAKVNIVIDNSFKINDISLNQSEKGMYIVMPSKRKANGNFMDVAHPINQETRQYIQNEIIKKYMEEN